MKKRFEINEVERKRVDIDLKKLQDQMAKDKENASKDKKGKQPVDPTIIDKDKAVKVDINLGKFSIILKSNLFIQIY